MTKTHTDLLYSQFPRLYRTFRLDTETEVSTQGLQCGDGWFQLIYDLSDQLYNCVSIEPVEAIEIKQKWGTLSYKVNVSNKEVDQIISDYVRLSNTICEHCGTTNATRHLCGSLHVVLCEVCANNSRDCAPEKKLTRR